MSASAINVLAALLEVRTGQHTASHRSTRMDAALTPLMRARGLDTLDDLVARLLDGRDPALAGHIVDALVNQETSFFRDTAVFDMMVEAVAAAEEQGRRVRIWSAGCSTGQEPLSLAMLFAERQEATGAPMPEIVASDISTAALARARSGRFSQFEIQRGLPIRRMMRWFEGDGSEWIARPELLRHIAFRQINLVADRPPGGAFDLILCRNVMLYLNPVPKAGAFDRLAHALAPGGLLVLGAGETVIGQTDRFEPSGRFRGFYQPAEGCAGGGRSAAKAA